MVVSIVVGRSGQQERNEADGLIISTAEEGGRDGERWGVGREERKREGGRGLPMLSPHSFFYAVQDAQRVEWHRAP